MGTPKETSQQKGINMKSGIIISLLLGIAICLVEVKGQCECTTRTAKTNTGAILGNCLTGDFNAGPNQGRKFCYVKGKMGVDECCQATTNRFVNLCVNYDVCDGGSTTTTAAPPTAETTT